MGKQKFHMWMIHIVHSIVLVEEASVSTQHISLISDDISCSFYDLVQYIYYIFLL